MCGIAGFLGATGATTPDAAVKAMTDVIAHRGPDADGAWLDAEAGVALGHRRLSIIDLSPLGAQPMHAASGRYVVAFNGEAYNYAPIRDELGRSGYPFRGHSDTEVLLAAFDRWGVEASIPRFAGMFAIAVWDRQERTLWLVRDRLGEKPLFYGRVGNAWAFGSELKCLRALPGWQHRVNIQAVTQFLRHGYVQAPATIYEGIAKVRPGTMVALRAGQPPREVTYWSAEAAARAGIADPIRGSEDEVTAALEATLLPVVKDEMVADVPLGAFLSGGVDSSLIVALMQEQAARPVRTFTIGFDDPRFNEAGFARQVAAHLGTDHTELMVHGDDALDLVGTLHETYDEPMADSSQLPTMLVSRLTRQHVTVALSGDGGDELFGGYSWHRGRGLFEKVAGSTPSLLRQPIGRVLGSIGNPPPDFVVQAMSGGRGATSSRPAHAISRLGEMLLSDGEQASFSAALALGVNPARLLRRELRASAGTGALAGPWIGDDRALESRMLLDATTYLPDDLLVKVDRAAMAYSLETRAPLLDHRVFELAWRIPYAMKVIDGTGKQPLRRMLYKRVPRALIDRPKTGFSVPLAQWLRGPLRPWAESLLSAPAVETGGVLDAARVAKIWSQHQRGVANHADILWVLTSLQAFLGAGGARR